MPLCKGLLWVVESGNGRSPAARTAQALWTSSCSHLMWWDLYCPFPYQQTLNVGSVMNLPLVHSLCIAVWQKHDGHLTVLTPNPPYGLTHVQGCSLVESSVLYIRNAKSFCRQAWLDEEVLPRSLVLPTWLCFCREQKKPFILSTGQKAGSDNILVCS